MNIVRAIDAKRFENASTCVAFEYETGGSDINIAKIQIQGRYPLEGVAMNQEVRELAYVVSGTGKVSVNGSVHELSAGDVISIEKGESVFWEGIFTLVIACTPAWSAEQYVTQKA